jgi:hypothetical protein
MRLIHWNKEVLQRMLTKIVQIRQARMVTKNQIRRNHRSDVTLQREYGKMVIDEVKEIITLPGVGDDEVKQLSRTFELDGKAVHQLELFVTEVATSYRDNPCKYNKL